MTEVKAVKKLVVCVCFCILMLLQPAVFASFQNDDIEMKAQMLTEIGVLPELTDKAKLDEPVTRRDFIIAAAKMLGIDTYRSNGTRYYRDMTSDDLAWNAANTLLEMRILTTNEQQRFRPDDTVTRGEAANVVTKMLGCREFDYDSTIAIADSIKLMNGVSSADIRMKDMICVLTNTMNAYMFENQPETPTRLTLKQTDKTFMETYYDMFYVEGTVSSVNDTSLISGMDSGKDRIHVGDTVITTKADDDFYDLLGCYAGAYYKEINDTPVLVTVAMRESKTQKVLIAAEDIEEFDEGSYTLKYLENNRKKSRAISKGANIIINGENVSNDIANVFKTVTNGSFTLIETDNNYGYETVIVSSYKNVMVQYTDAINMKIFGTHNEVISLDEDNTEYVISNAGGEKIDFESIAANSVISWFGSSKLNRLVVSTGSAAGEIKQIRTEGEDTYLNIDGNEYKVDREFFKKTDMSLTLNASVICFIDAYGAIADIKAGRSSNGTFAWIIKCWYEDYEPDELFLKVYTENGELLDLPVAENVKIDGNTCRTGGDKIDKLSINGSQDGQLVLLELNDDKEIKRIDTTKAGKEDNGLFISTPESENYFYAGQMLLGPTIQLTSATKLFIVPNSNAYKTDSDAYQVVTGNTFFKDWELYKVTGYRTGSNKEAGYTEALVMKTDIKGINGFRTANKNIFIVSGIKEVYDEESGDAREEIELLSGKTTAVYMNAAGYSFKSDPNVRIGNVIRITNNSKGEVSASTLIYGEDEDGIMIDGSGNLIWATRDQSEVGYITSLKDGLLSLSLKPAGETSLVIKTANVPVAVYDENKREPVFTGDEGDLIDAYNNRYAVVIDISRGVVRSISVIKK